MAPARHRRPKRTRGFRLFSTRGRRRRTVDESPPSPEELARQADSVARARARRRIIVSLLGAGLVVALSVGATLAMLRPPAEEGGGPAEPDAEGASLLLVASDQSGDAATMALVAVHPRSASQVVLFPPALLATLPGFGEGVLADSLDFGGPQLASLTVMNLLGVRVHSSVVVPPAAWEEIMTEPLTVQLSRPLLVAEGDAGEVVAVAEGEAPREPATVARLLTVQGTDDQLGWLQRQGDVLRALLRRAAEDSQTAGRLASYGDGGPRFVQDTLVTAGADPDLLVTAVPVSRLQVGGETERYQLSGDQAAAFVGDRLAFLRLGDEPRPRVEVLNGNGRVGTTRVVAAALIRQGFRVVKTDNADRFTYASSQVIAHGRQHQEEAARVLEVLGRGELILELRRPSAVVDLTIIVGQDIPAEEA